MTNETAHLSCNWIPTQIGKLCILRNGRAFKSSEWDQEGLPIVRIQNLNKPDAAFNYYSGKVPEKFLIENGQLLFAWSGTPGTSFGAHIWRGGTAVLNQHIFKIEFNESNLDKTFFQLSINQKLNELIENARGGVGLRHVTKGKFESTKINIPPLPEQQRIVAILEKAFAAISKAKENAEKNLQNTHELFQAYLHNVFANPISSWEVKPLGEVCEIITRGVSPKYIEINGLCVSNQKCIRNHEVNYNVARLHDDQIKPVSNEKLIQIGDVLVNSTGTGTLGRVAQVRENPIKSTVDSHITIVRPIKDQFYNDFFGYAMIFLEEEISKRGEGCGGQTELSRNTLKNDFTIAYPSSISQQQQIAAKLDALSLEAKKLQTIYQERFVQLEALKKSLLQKAFNGELIEIGGSI